MLVQTPCKVSQEKVTFDVKELEAILSAPAMDLKPYPPAAVTLKDGRTMLIKQANKEDAPKLLAYLKKLLDVEHDFYDIVGARVYAEVLGWYRNRLKDPYTLVGLIDGECVGFANGRLMDEDVNISLHTLAFSRGNRIGAIMYYAKCEYTFEILNQEEFWATYESYNGLKRWGIGMAQPSYPWPDYQHELGGARVYYVTKKYWEKVVKNYMLEMTGCKLVRPVTEELLKKNENFFMPAEVMV